MDKTLDRSVGNDCLQKDISIIPVIEHKYEEPSTPNINLLNSL